MAEDDKLDGLLARYLQLLDTYTTLRTELSELQSSVYHSLARANFSAERGIRYGQDFYDERMQAMKLLTTEQSEDGLPSFSLLDLNAKTEVESEEKKTEEIAEKLEQTTLTPKSKPGQTETAEDDHESASETRSEPPLTKSKDPLRWFGILGPPSLRQAQSSASALVETIVKLSSIDAEMKDMEIEIRRARKRKVKIEGKAGKAVPNGKKETAAGENEVRHKQEMEEPVKVNRGGGCGRVAI